VNAAHRLMAAALVALAVGFSLPSASAAAVPAPPGIDANVNVAAIVVTSMTGPTGVVTGNSLQTVTVTVRNDLPRALASVRVTIDGVDNNGPQSLAVPAGATRTATFTTVPCRSGTSTITSSVSATDGAQTLTATGDPLTMRVAAGSTCTTNVNTPAGTLTLTTSAGRVVGLTSVPLAGLPTPPAGMNLPYGAISFTIEDLEPGASVSLRINVPGPATSYAKLTASGWTLIPGAVTIGNGVAVTLTDGGVGDADGVANGRIVDPGAVVGPPQQAPGQQVPTTTTSPAPSTVAPPSVAPSTTATASTVPASTVPASAAAIPIPGAVPRTPPGGSPTDNLPRTGGGPAPILVGAGIAMGVGALLLVARRRRRSNGTHDSALRPFEPN